jgi:hypothetical protein
MGYEPIQIKIFLSHQAPSEGASTHGSNSPFFSAANRGGRDEGRRIETYNT